MHAWKCSAVTLGAVSVCVVPPSSSVSCEAPHSSCFSSALCLSSVFLLEFIASGVGGASRRAWAASSTRNTGFPSAPFSGSLTVLRFAHPGLWWRVLRLDLGVHTWLCRGIADCSPEWPRSYPHTSCVLRECTPRFVNSVLQF